MLLFVQILIIALVLVNIFTKKVQMLSMLVATILFLLTFPNTFPNIGMNIYLIMLFLAFLFCNLIDSFIRPLSYTEETIIVSLIFVALFCLDRKFVIAEIDQWFYYFDALSNITFLNFVDLTFVIFGWIIVLINKKKQVPQA
ncbi:MAG: hypothetical protein IKN62_02365 [Elusimicrobia bacterium]|nr:hypothetical protein [Elusimicrobiota bacterium]